MRERAQISLAAGIVTGSALAGLLGLPFWVFLPGGVSLSLISLWDQEKLRPRFAAVGATSMLASANLASLADSCLVTGAAWCVGAAFRFVLQSV
jgi:hypothetical protein